MKTSPFKPVKHTHEIFPYFVDTGDIGDLAYARNPTIGYMNRMALRDDNRRSQQDWIRDNCTGSAISIDHGKWRFELQEDATLFALFFAA